tara:strand:- start:153 stop:467 length:315 start_codon:yes stop_codon:yes gene_type:complete
MKKLWEKYKAHNKKVKEAQANFKVSDIKNKYFRALMWIFMLKFVWDITTLFEKYLPMKKVYKILGLGWTKLGYYVFWLLWFIFLGVLLYNILGEEAFNQVINEL